VPGSGRSPLGKIGPARREPLDAIIVRVGDQHVSGPIDGHATGELELTVAGPGTAPAQEERPVAAELLDTLVLAVSHVDLAQPIHRNPRGPSELTVGGPRGPPFGHELLGGPSLRGKKAGNKQAGPSQTVKVHSGVPLRRK